MGYRNLMKTWKSDWPLSKAITISRHGRYSFVTLPFFLSFPSSLICIVDSVCIKESATILLNLFRKEGRKAARKQVKHTRKPGRKQGRKRRRRGRKLGRREGNKQTGTTQGNKKESKEASKETRKKAKKQGRMQGSKQGSKKGARKESREETRRNKETGKEGSKEGGKQGNREGSKEGREEARKKARKQVAWQKWPFGFWISKSWMGVAIPWAIKLCDDHLLVSSLQWSLGHVYLHYYVFDINDGNFWWISNKQLQTERGPSRHIPKRQIRSTSTMKMSGTLSQRPLASRGGPCDIAHGAFKNIYSAVICHAGLFSSALFAFIGFPPGCIFLWSIYGLFRFALLCMIMTTVGFIYISISFLNSEAKCLISPSLGLGARSFYFRKLKSAAVGSPQWKAKASKQPVTCRTGGLRHCQHSDMWATDRLLCWKKKQKHRRK